MIKNPFVKEVLRIIQEELACRFNSRTIVLVSGNFYKAAGAELAIRNQILGLDLTTSEGHVVLRGVHLLPVGWLSDYEFEVRR
jgi:hypothetical protein